MNAFRSLLLFLTVIISLAGSAPGQVASKAVTREVNVYFMSEGLNGGRSEILPLKRLVSSAAPLYPSIAAMLLEPTDTEKKLGYVSAGYGGMKLKSVKVTRGTARVDFTRIITPDYNPGDLQTLYFEDAVIKTAKQFRSVKKVIVCVNGINEFGIGMVEGRPYPCPRSK